MRKTQSGLSLVILLLLFSTLGMAQNRITGKVISDADDTPVAFANVLVKGTTVGETTDVDGKFTIETEMPLPLTLRISFTGYETQMIEVTYPNQELLIRLKVGETMLALATVEAPRETVTFLEAPVTLGLLRTGDVAASSSFDPYDELKRLPGVHSNQASITYNTINTRGFATGENTRLVQLVDGVDNSAPILNFPLGSIVGLSDLDIHSIELMHGAASPLYGPNAFNGILLMNSKNPFDYQGLSAQAKYGMTDSEAAGGTDPMWGASVRYAKAFNDRIAFKVNFSMMQAEDWMANDYTADRNLLAAAADDPSVDPEGNVGAPNFDGLNTYGDETQIFVPVEIVREPFPEVLWPVFDQIGPVQVTRTGFGEDLLLESRDAKSIKGDAALHYRFGEGFEAIYNYHYGQGSAVYQGSERFALRDFTQQYHKLELKKGNSFIRTYLTQTDDGDTYNLTALGAQLNERFAPSEEVWVPTYLENYYGWLVQEILNGNELTDELRNTAHMQARGVSDRFIPDVKSQEFKDKLEEVRTDNFQEGGAGFIDDSRVYHAEFQYDMAPLLDNKLGVLVGGNWRQFDLFTDGTILNEDPENTGTNERLKVNEFGGFVQLSKQLIDKRLGLTGSVRYDKNENFEGQFSPRFSVTYSAGKEREHNFRASVQTGFRNPATIGQFIYFPATTINVGGTKDNAERYGIYKGGAWTKSSFDQYQGCLLMGGNPETCGALLETIDIDYVQPEKLTSYEVGYRANINRKFLIDFHTYYNSYRDFIVEARVVNMDPTSHQGQEIPVGKTWDAYTNVDEKVTSWGGAIGLAYDLTDHLNLWGNYSYADFDLDNPDFQAKFNTPKNRFNVGLTGRNLFKNLGFGVSYRWQEEFFYESGFGAGMVPAFGSLDAQVSWRVPDVNATVKVGGTNLFGDDYRTNIGNPYIGQTYFVSLTFDELFK